MNDSEDLLRRAMSLPAEACAALAGSLLRSLESAVDADAEAAWSAEIQRRLTDLDTGRVNAVDLDEARRRISG
ncbi:MAG: addiction module protein [Planctomycetota bacterium]